MTMGIVDRVVDINALRALAPLPSSPCPGHHVPSPARRPPLEPRAQLLGGQCRSMADYVAVTGATDEASAAGWR